MKKTRHHPPTWADRLLEWYCDPLVLEDLQGDLYERFNNRMMSHSRLKANILYFRDVLMFIRPYTVKRNKHSLNPSLFFMLPNYFKSSTRSLRKEKLNTSVSVVGLALGLSVFTLISLYVNDELKYDRFLPIADRIYRVTMSYTSASSSEHTAWAEPTVGLLLKEYEDIVAATALVNEKSVVRNDSKVFREERFFYTNKSYFEVFPYPVVRGSVNTFEPGMAVVTKSTAHKYFGKEDPINRTLQVDKKEFKVVALMDDLPEHTDLKFDALLAIDDLAKISGWTFNYILLKDERFAKSLQAKLDKVFEESIQLEFDSYGTKGKYHAEALPDVHFGSPKLFDTPKSSRTNLYLFSSVAILILVIAGINHLNLSLASTTTRQMEVGIRKAIGAQNEQLRFQFLIKSFLVCFLSLIMAIVLVLYCLPFLNSLTGKSITWSELMKPGMISYLLGSVIFLALLSGSYPAFYLASAKPMTSLKGLSKLGRKNLLLKGSVVFQFTISFVLIISTLFISRQMNLVLSKSHGMTSDPVMMVDVPWDSEVRTLVNQLKNQLTTFPFVRSAAVAGFNSWPTSDMAIDAVEVRTDGEWLMKPFNNIEVDASYFKVLGLEFIEGRPFNSEEVNGSYETVVVNRALVENLGWKNPLQETIVYENGTESRVVGVIQNFNFNSVKSQFEPILIFPDDRFPAKLLIKIDKELGLENIEQIEHKWKEQLKDQPFDFQFLKSSIQDQYQNDITMEKLLNFFVITAICIACLGLFGLMALSTSQRIREVGIRKVFGAGSGQLWLLLSKNYVALILIAFSFAIPLTIIGINSWLEGFVYHIPLTVDVFIIAGLTTVLAGLLAMSIHIIKAIMVNPTKILSHE